MNVSASFRQELYSNRSFSIYQFNLSIPLSTGLAVRSSFAHQKRLPTFNERYWPGAGNLNIKPEKAYLRNATLEFEDQNIEVSVSYKHNSYFDFIEWFNDDFSNLRVENINQYQQSMWTSRISYMFLNVDVGVHHEYDRIRNNDGQRYYAPKHTFKLSSLYEDDVVQARIAYQITDSFRIPNVVLPAPKRHQFDASTSLSFQFKSYILQLNIRINNILKY